LFFTTKGLAQQKPFNEWNWFSHCDQFRCGNYKNADDDIKTAWTVFCDYILERVNRKWADKMVKSNKLLSEVVTPSDEAYALLISKDKMSFWVTQKVKTPQKPTAAVTRDRSNSDSDVSAPKEVEELAEIDEKDSKKGESSEIVRKFYALYNVVKKKRQDDDEGVSWDQGFKDAVAQAATDGRSKGSSSSVSSVTLLSETAMEADGSEVVDVDEW
jgi:hypothetical protein